MSDPPRPRTANPKLELLNFEHGHQSAIIAHNESAHQANSPLPHSGRVFGEGSVLWSQETVAAEDLMRPHTSNPRYVEMAIRMETPRKSSPHIVDSPSRLSQATTSAVLWSSEANGISPAMLARPITSNPWLSRFLDGVPDAKGEANSVEGRKVEILWSDKEIEDWRLLARPHASNPVMEASAAAAQLPVNENAPSVSEVIWSSGEAVEETHDVSQLRKTIHSQARRIAELEAFVGELQRQLNTQTREGPTPVDRSVERPFKPSPAELVADKELVEVTATHPRTIPEGKGPAAASYKVVSPVPIQPSRPAERAPLDDRSPRRLDLDAEPPIGAVSVPISRPAGGARPTDEVADDVMEDCTEVADEDKAFQSSSAKQADRAKFVDRLRGTTTSSAVTASVPARPDTATTTRPPAAPTSIARPMSAPATHGTESRRFCSLPPSYPSMHSRSITAEDTIREAYDDLCVPGNTTVSKDSFRKMYLAKAQEYGIPCSRAALDRMLRPYHSVGENYLSFEEFAVLYLQVQRW